jgi:hypothetical protein
MSINAVPGIDTEPQKAFFQMLGLICRSRPASASYHVTQELLKIGRKQETGGRATSTDHSLGASNRFRENYEIPHRELHMEQMLPKYTSTLYEEAARCGVVPRRSLSILSLAPPQLKVTIQFGALEATGIGRNKKIAGHLAAKALCDKLKLGFDRTT